MADEDFKLTKEFSLKEHLKDNTHRAELDKHVEQITDAYEIGKDGHKVRFKKDGEVGRDIGALQKAHDVKELAAKEKDVAKEVMDKHTKTLEEAGVKVHRKLDVIAEHAENYGKDLKKAQDEVRKKILEADKSPEEMQKMLDAFNKESQELAEHHGNASKYVSHHRAEAQKLSGKKSEGKVQNFTEVPHTPSASAAKGIDGKRIAIGAEKFEKLGWFGKGKEATAQAWSHGGFMRKTGAVAGTGVGVIIVGKGLKNLGRFVGMASPEQDEAGKDIPADVGTLVKSVAQLAGGGAVAYFSLTAGGKGHALGK